MGTNELMIVRFSAARPGSSRSWLLVAAAFMAPVGFAAAAAAQDSAQESTAASEEGVIEEIIVTAQRRAERLQDVPLAVTAANAEALADAQVDSIEEIQAISPSISFDKSNNSFASPNIQIRGIGTVGNSRTFEGAVGVFIDGVYRSRAGQALQNWLDVDSVQILRGPQGTLFGRNTSAGAFLLTSAAPRIGEVGGTYELTYGNYDALTARAALNLPISDKAAFRIAGLASRIDGFVEDPNNGRDYNGSDSLAAKAQLLLEPTEDLRFRLIADWSRGNADCCYGTVDANPASAPSPTQGLIDALTAGQGLNPPSHDPDDYEAVLNRINDTDSEDRGVSLQADWDVLGGTLRSLTAYRRWTVDARNGDSDFSGADIVFFDEDFDSEQFSQEFTFVGEVGQTPLFQSADYVVGAYYSTEDIVTTRNLYWGDDAQTFFDTLLFAGFGLPPGTLEAAPGLWERSEMFGESTTKAIFSHWTLNFTDKLSLIAGGRYSWETRKGGSDGTFFRFVGAAPPVFIGLGVLPGPDYTDSFKEGAFSGTLGLRYRFSPDAMAYVTYSRGFKSGGVNIDPNGAGLVANNPDFVPGATLLDPTFKSEFIDGYEVGFKLDYLDGRARTNVAIFYNDIKNLQVAQFLGFQFQILNAPSATVSGAEIENTFQLTDALELQLNAIYLNEATFATSALLGPPLSGRDFAHAPKFAAGGSLAYEREITNGIAFTSRAAVQHSGKQFTNTASNLTEDAVTLFDLSAGLRSLDHGWAVNVWCQNCTDKRYIVQHFETPLQTGDRNGFVGAPRTFGVTLRGTF